MTLIDMESPSLGGVANAAFWEIGSEEEEDEEDIDE
jgi:hypothetical protein